LIDGVDVVLTAIVGFNEGSEVLYSPLFVGDDVGSAVGIAVGSLVSPK
jgi:hypothetical protein